jgi:hypothetical protein
LAGVVPNDGLFRGHVCVCVQPWKCDGDLIPG